MIVRNGELLDGNIVVVTGTVMVWMGAWMGWDEIE